MASRHHRTLNDQHTTTRHNFPASDLDAQVALLSSPAHTCSVRTQHGALSEVQSLCTFGRQSPWWSTVGEPSDVTSWTGHVSPTGEVNVRHSSIPSAWSNKADIGRIHQTAVQTARRLPPITWLPEVLFLGFESDGAWVWLLTPPRAEVKNDPMYSSIPPPHV
jgi:hypothetical protein